MLRLGSRSSQLARWQAEFVQAELATQGIDVEIRFISTEGDLSAQSLKEFGGQGAFTKSIQKAILENEIDFAVHSLKDLPTEVIPGLHLASVPVRETTCDALICRRFDSLKELPAESVIGTGSLRRQAQLLHHRPDLKVEDIRGNVETRLRKLDEGQYDAVILAKAGLLRLNLHEQITEEFSVEQLLPAVGQGALGLECRSEDEKTIQALQTIDHQPSHAEATAERSLLRELRAGCLAPVGVNSHWEGELLRLKGVVLSQDGKERIMESLTRAATECHELGVELAELLKAKGADRLLDRG